MKKVNWKDLQRGDFVAGGCVAIVFAAVAGLIGDWLFGVLAGLVTGYVAAVARRRYLTTLQKRAAVPDGIVWDVELNGVKVGTVSDSDYAAMRLNVFTDWRNYVAQLLNTGRVAMRVFDSLFVALPVLVFWCVVAAAIFAPDALASALTSLQSATPEQLAAGAVNAARILALLGLMSAGLNAMIGARYGFVNRFSEATAHLLRRRVGAAAEGNLVLLRWADGTLHFNDELHSLKGGV